MNAHANKVSAISIRILVSIAFLTLGVSMAPAEPGSGIAELTKLAENGDRQASLSLGMRYRDGRGVKRDHAEALKWYRRCADAGDAAGLDNVGFMYLSGWGVPEDFTIAAAYFKASAAGNHDQGLFNLGKCYFSGQGVAQDYSRAIDAWRRAADLGNQNARWRLAMLCAAGEGMPRDREEAKTLCLSIARKEHVDGMVLLGELHARAEDNETAGRWWKKASGLGSVQAGSLLALSKWRGKDRVPGTLACVEVDHLYQGWNNCGATSLAMFLRHAGVDTTPYAVKRLCPQSPIGTGTDWAHLVAAGETLGERLDLLTFPNDDTGFRRGIAVIRKHLDAGRPVVIDFTVTRKQGGRTKHFGHTLLVVGYNTELDQFVLKNPNQPSPGIQLMSAKELKENWFSRGYSRSANGRAARPLIVMRTK